MKTMKSKKKGIAAKLSSSSIQDYFKTTSKESGECEAPAPRDVKSVYVRALLDKVKRFDKEETNDSANPPLPVTADIGAQCLDGNVRDETEEAAAAAAPILSTLPDKPTTIDRKSDCEECEMWKKKYEELKKSYVKLSLRHSETLMKNDDLLKAATSNIRPTNGEESESVAEPLPTSDELFTENEVRYLRSIPLDKKKDSTFVLQCVEYAYKTDRKSLCNRTLKGTVDRIEVIDGVATVVRAGKGPMTPEKVKRIEQLFIDRVAKSKCLAGEFGERVKSSNINRLIASAIKNLSNKEKQDDIESNPNSDLNL